MSSNITLMNSTEDKNQDQKMTLTKVPSLVKLESASKNLTEQIGKLDIKKRYVPSLDKSGSALKTETDHTEKLESKKRSVQLSSSDDKKMAGLD